MILFILAVVVVFFLLTFKVTIRIYRENDNSRTTME